MIATSITKGLKLTAIVAGLSAVFAGQAHAVSTSTSAPSGAVQLLDGKVSFVDETTSPPLGDPIIANHQITTSGGYVSSIVDRVGDKDGRTSFNVGAGTHWFGGSWDLTYATSYFGGGPDHAYADSGSLLLTFLSAGSTVGKGCINGGGSDPNYFGCNGGTNNYGVGGVSLSGGETGALYFYSATAFDTVVVSYGLNASGCSSDCVHETYGLSNIVVSSVPEPETYAMMFAGLGVMGFLARRRRAR